MAVSKRARFDVFKRDGFVCQYCGQTPPGVVLEVDHIHPIAEGGLDEVDNLITACFDCNRGKGARLLDTSPASIAEKASLLASKREQLREYEKLLSLQRRDIEDAVERVDDIFSGNRGANLTESGRRSVRQFLEQLPPSEVFEAAEIGTETFEDPNRAFKYFCGVCWRKIRGE